MGRCLEVHLVFFIKNELSNQQFLNYSETFEQSTSHFQNILATFPICTI